ncbi:hypothetical protein [Methyloglobulus sp.]|uniref:hypothetical protein n=1 Tax=Methyloglobulus sp. TaxID=2518622 RepID=UPI00398960C9
MSSHSFNRSKPFPPCPAPSDRPLPFAIDEMDFSIWLKTLANADDMAKCQQILQVLQTLNNAYPPGRDLIPGRTRLFFLEKLGSVLTAVTAVLTLIPDITDEPTPVEDELPLSEISVWGNLELGNAYSLLSQEDWFKDDEYYSIEEKTLILSNGIQAMGRGLLYIFQTYTNPHAFFWHKCFQLYRFALQYRLTDSEFNPNAQLIDNAFKRVLVLALSNTKQFSQHEMRTIYDLLGHYSFHAGLLKSVPKKKFRGIPSIHLKGYGQPAISHDDSDIHDPDLLYIATVTVASKILEATYDKHARHVPTDRLMLLRLAKTLTLNEQRKDPREIAQRNHLGSMGFGNIVEFLRSKEIEKQNFLAETGLFDPSRPGELRDLDFEIVSTEGKRADTETSPNPGKSPNKTMPPPAFQIVEFTAQTEIWNTSNQDHHKTNMCLVDKSAKGYGLLWTDDLIKPKVANIIGIMHKNLIIGLIRWLAQSKETGMFMGVELLGGNATVVKVSNPGYPNIEVSAIFLPGGDAAKQFASLIFMNKGFRPSEFIFLNKNHKKVRYRMIKQLHLTSFINHVEVIRSY